MLVKKISFIPPDFLDEIPEIEDANLDVLVELEDGYTYTVTVVTPKNLISLMDRRKANFLGPITPLIVIRTLTKEIIEEAVKAYAEEDDAYWLKHYHFAGQVDMSVFDQLQAEHIEYLKEFDELD